MEKAPMERDLCFFCLCVSHMTIFPSSLSNKTSVINCSIMTTYPAPAQSTLEALNNLILPTKV